MGNHENRSIFPLVLLFAYVILFTITAIAPYSREVWWAEIIPILAIVTLLVATYPRFRFSNLSYAMMAVLVYLHTIGAHYTFELVPFDFVTNLFGFQRNHFDRIAHFSVGFYAYPIAEILLRKQLVSSKLVLILFPVCVIFTAASLYEIIEWLYAAFSDPAAGSAFLGSQGDIWDAQKDMLADGLGGIVAIIIFLLKPPTINSHA